MTQNQIQGNTSAQQAQATTSRPVNKSRWTENSGRALIALFIASVGIVAALATKDNLFYAIIAGAITIFVGNRISGMKKGASADTKKLIWHWGGIIQVSGVITIMVCLLTSGPVKLTSKAVSSVNQAATCAAMNEIERAASSACEKPVRKTAAAPIRTVTQAAAVAVPSAPKPPVVKDCAWDYQADGFVDCQSVTIFEGGEPFVKSAPTYTCLHARYYPNEVTEEALTPYKFKYTVKPGQYESQFDVFGFPQGTSYNDAVREAAGLEPRPCNAG